uniref:Sigma-70 family RNA polymerase sigma factor n=1 Tax=Schlesneria paludicola TaxID=360056 RepID=A0A7C4LM83_9PLAN
MVIVSDGNRQLIVQEIARHQSRLRGFVRCLLVRSNDVDDVLQEINAVLWEKADEFQPGTDFWGWASQIARFKVLNHIRKLGRERLVFDDAILEQLAEIAACKLSQFDQRRAALDHCLQQLPPPQRKLLDLRYTAGHTIELIGESIGRPAGSVRQALYRIRTALQACIERQLATGGEPS